MGSIPISSTNSSNNLAARYSRRRHAVSTLCLFQQERHETVWDFLELKAVKSTSSAHHQPTDGHVLPSAAKSMEVAS